MYIIFCIPTHNNSINCETMLSLIKCIDILKEKKYKYKIIYKSGSHINQLRNRLVYYFLQEQGDYLFFIDNDVSGFEQGFKFMIENNFNIIGIPYPKKGFNNNLLLNNIVNKRNLFINSTDFNINLLSNEKIKEYKNNKILKVKHLATGCLMINKKVFNKLINKVDIYIEEGNKLISNFFHSDVKDNFYLTEDYFFCELCRNNDYDINALINIELKHHGQFIYTGCFYDYLNNIKL